MTVLQVDIRVGVETRWHSRVLIYLDLHSHCSNLFRLFSYKNNWICLTSKASVSLFMLSLRFYLRLTLSVFSFVSLPPFPLLLLSNLSPLFSLPCFCPSFGWSVLPVYNVLSPVVNQPVGLTPHWSLLSPRCPGRGQTLGACWLIFSVSLRASPPMVARLGLLLSSTLLSASSSLLCHLGLLFFFQSSSPPLNSPI